jgi:hypothetical protein
MNSSNKQCTVLPLEESLAVNPRYVTEPRFGIWIAFFMSIAFPNTVADSFNSQGGIMTTHLGCALFIAGIGLIGWPVASPADETSSSTHQLAPRFPASEKCTAASPCRDVIGEIVKIEESYWVKLPNGNQTHMRVSPETKIESRVKIGDTIAAQLTSTGEADAIMKFEEKPEADELSKSKGSLKDMR